MLAPLTTQLISAIANHRSSFSMWNDVSAGNFAAHVVSAALIAELQLLTTSQLLADIIYTRNLKRAHDGKCWGW